MCGDLESKFIGVFCSLSTSIQEVFFSHIKVLIVVSQLLKLDILKRHCILSFTSENKSG